MAPSAKSKHPTQSTLNHSLAGIPGYAYPAQPSHRSAQSEGSDILNEDEERARALLDLSIALIDAALDVLEKHVKSDEQLRKESALMPGGTVGKHFRHVIEMFQAFLLPLLPSRQPNASTSSSSPSSSRADGVIKPEVEIDYDAILPSTRRSVARSISACRGAMRDVREGLIRWEDGVRSRSPPARSSADTHAIDEGGSVEGIGQGVAGEARAGGLAEEMQRRVRLVAVTPTKQVMASSVGRELWFCSLHAIHHFSMLRTIAVHELGLDLPVEFGTAPSTLLYRGKNWTPPKERKEIRVVKSKL